MGDNNIRSALATIKDGNKTQNKVWIWLLSSLIFVTVMYYGVQEENEKRRQDFIAECNLINSAAECSRLLDIIDPPPDLNHFT